MVLRNAICGECCIFAEAPFFGRLVSVGEAGLEHALAEAALFDEILFQPAELLMGPMGPISDVF